MSSPPPTLINTAWPFGRQCLAFYNEFPSGAAGLNVTHSQLQFGLGCGDVCGWGSGHHVCVWFVTTDDKVNRHQTPLMKISNGKHRRGEGRNRGFTEYCGYVFGDMFSARSQDRQNARINATDSVRFFFWAWPFRLDRVYYSIKCHRTHWP